MVENAPCARRDLEFVPVRHRGEQLVLVRDPLGLVREGQAIPLPLYAFLAALDGTKTDRDLQLMLMRERGGALVSMEEVQGLIGHLDAAYLLGSERYLAAKKRIVHAFASDPLRRPSHCGKSYPEGKGELGAHLDAVLSGASTHPRPEGRVKAVIAPHIDLAVGREVYASAYAWIREVSPARIILLGVGHQLGEALFSLTEKDFETPLGVSRNDRSTAKRLRKSAGSLISGNDFVHRSEHSIEFQLIFLQHLFGADSFTIVPILCGSVQPFLTEYSRRGYVKAAQPLCDTLRGALDDARQPTVVVAGVDFSHIGPKFGHDMTALRLERETKAHDEALLEALQRLEADAFWEESARVKDRFNVCGFSALACLLEVLTNVRGHLLNYAMWHEEPTESAVSFAALGYASLPS